MKIVFRKFMFNIILASLSVGIGSYVLRKGDLFGVLLFFLKKNIVYPNTIFMTILGIFLNLIGKYNIGGWGITRFHNFICEAIGYLGNVDNGKVMGLAGYGQVKKKSLYKA